MPFSKKTRKLARLHFDRRRAFEDERLEEFRRRTEELSVEEEFPEKGKIAREIFGRPVGRGSEAVVFEVDDYRLLKLTIFPDNARAEYVIFSDPDFQKVTPEVYGHGPDWEWYVVERVRDIRRWEVMFKFFPTLESIDNLQDRVTAFSDILAELQSGGELPEIWSRMNRSEREWFEKIVRLHDLLDLDGLALFDIGPKNLGVDRDGNLVLFDILTQ